MKRNGGKYSLQQPIESAVRHGIKIYLERFTARPNQTFVVGVGHKLPERAGPLSPPPFAYPTSAPSVLCDRISSYINTYTMKARMNTHC